MLLVTLSLDAPTRKSFYSVCWKTSLITMQTHFMVFAFLLLSALKYDRVHWTHNGHRDMMQYKKGYKKWGRFSPLGLNDFISAASWNNNNHISAGCVSRSETLFAEQSQILKLNTLRAFHSLTVSLPLCINVIFLQMHLNAKMRMSSGGVRNDYFCSCWVAIETPNLTRHWLSEWLQKNTPRVAVQWKGIQGRRE